MTKSTALQKRARALQTERGIGYHAALNLAREQTDLRRTITATLRPGERPGRHVLTVEGRDHTVFDGDLGRYLDGWTPSPGQDVGRLFATGAGPLELVRDEQGQLEDQADAVWAGTDCRRFGASGPGIFDTHLPYLLAVVAGLEAAGARIADFDLYTDEDRRMHVTLAAGPDHVPDDKDDTRRWVLAWIDDRGWFTFLEPGPGGSVHVERQHLCMSSGGSWRSLRREMFTSFGSGSTSVMGRRPHSYPTSGRPSGLLVSCARRADPVIKVRHHGMCARARDWTADVDHFGRHESLVLFDCRTARRGQPRCST
ncbi:hypothetical protein [Streptomyces sp. NBC_01718]|uniref:hypothetical protein n=1 Tax=Streptomyces sp. NBC_01718 TaxID=2975919 RepID=UPI00352E5C84